MSQYWAESGIAPSDLKLFVNNKNCGAQKETFLGCVNALRELTAASTPATELAPHGGKLIAVPYSSNLLVAGRSSAALDELKAKSRARVLKLTEFFESAEAVRPDFEALLDESISKLSSNSNFALLLATAINAYYSAARDPHTYIVPKAYRDDPDPGAFSGVGIDLQIVGDQLVVMRPKKNSPALRAGIRAGDIVLEADGVALAGLSLDDAVTHIRGPVATFVRLKIFRGGQTLEFDVRRETISTPNITYRLLDDGMGKLGYVSLGTFQDAAACAGVRSALKDLIKDGAQGLILDLRDNLGGYVEQASCIAGLFIGPWKTVSYLYKKEEIMVFFGIELRKVYDPPIFDPQMTPSAAKLTDLPLTILINGYSASASEILAGAMQDLGRALIVGERSYGKGTFQAPRLFNDKLKIQLMETGGRFYLPSKRTNQIVGIMPDLMAAGQSRAQPVREEDLYVNALPPQGEPWLQPRPELMQKLSACIQTGGRAGSLFEKNRNDAIPGDYQVYFAEEALACLATLQTGDSKTP